MRVSITDIQRHPTGSTRSFPPSAAETGGVRQLAAAQPGAWCLRVSTAHKPGPNGSDHGRSSAIADLKPHPPLPHGFGGGHHGHGTRAWDASLQRAALLLITAAFLLLGGRPSAHAGWGLDREAYGVWDREGGHSVTSYPYTRGQAYWALWSAIEPSRTNFNWTALDAALQFADDQNQKFTVQISPIGGPSGSTVPLWMSNNVPLFKESPDLAQFTYGYYLDPDYQLYFQEMVQGLARHLRTEVSPALRSRIAFVRCDTGATGDEAPYENPNNITNIYRISSADWRTFRLWVFEVYRQAFQDGTNGPVIPLLFQDIEQTGFPIEWNWVTNTVQGGFGGKYGGAVRGHNLNGSQDVTDSYRLHAVGGSLRIFSRNEMDQTWQDMNMFQRNLPLCMYWCAVEQLHPGQSVWDVSGTCLESASAGGYVSSFEFFNKWAAELEPPTAGGGFCIFHDGLDSSDTGRFPESSYGMASKTNTGRYLAICAANAGDGARMDDPSAVTAGQVYQRNNQVGFNDSGWRDVPGNYERFITQLNPNGTSKGVWRINGATNGSITSASHPFDRFARSFDHAAGKNAMYFDITNSLLPSPGQRIQLSVIYRDRGTGQFALLYDAVTDSRKTAFAVTKGNSLTWKTSTVMVADWAFNNRGPNGADLVLTNLGTDDTIFHSVELIKLADVHVGTVGRGSVSGRTDGVVHASLAGTFMERQRMELTVTPAANWRFAGWSGELTGTNTRPFLFPTRDSQVTATFTYIPGSGATSADDFNSGTLTGGTGWSGGWTTTGTVTPTTNTDVGGYTILLQSGGIMTRALATPLANATLSFHWDIDSLEAGESGVVEVSANGTTWQQVWSKDMADNGTDTQNQPDLLTNTTVNLAAYGTVSHLRFKAIMGAGDRFWIDNVSVTAQAATNSSPLFTSDPINRPPATNGAPYAATLAGEASDPGGNPLSFSKVSGSGPSWLNVSANGALSGTPASTNMGLNSWLIRITNGVGGSDEAILLIQVTNINLVTPSGPPVITSARISGGSFIFSGTNATATAGGTYFVLATNNVAIPLADWPRISTNTYGVGGAFSVTIPVNWATPGVFYRLEQ